MFNETRQKYEYLVNIADLRKYIDPLAQYPVYNKCYLNTLGINCCNKKITSLSALFIHCIGCRNIFISTGCWSVFKTGTNKLQIVCYSQPTNPRRYSFPTLVKFVHLPFGVLILKIKTCSIYCLIFPNTLGKIKMFIYFPMAVFGGHTP